jgi:hypothetical protein
MTVSLRQMMMVSRHSLYALAIAALATRAVVAQSDSSATETAQRYLDAINTERWSEVAGLLDPDAVFKYAKELREQRRERERAPRRTESFETVESMMRRDTTITRAVAEYLYAKTQRYQAFDPDAVSVSFADVQSNEELHSLSDTELVVRKIRAVLPAYQVRIVGRLCAQAPNTGGASPAAMLRAANARSPRVSRVRAIAMLSPDEAVALFEHDELSLWAMTEQFSQLRMRRTPDGWRVPVSALSLRQVPFGVFAFGCSDDGGQD